MTLNSELKILSFFLTVLSFFFTLKVHATPSFFLHFSKHLPQNLAKKPLLATNLAENTVRLKDVFMTQKNVSSDLWGGVIY